MVLVFPTGTSLIGAIISLAIIGSAIFILWRRKPKIKIVFYGTIGAALIVLGHLFTTSTGLDTLLMSSPEFIALLICILAQLLWIALDPKPVS